MKRWPAYLLALALSPLAAAAQTPVAERPPADAPSVLGPPAPIAPAVERRDADGRVTVRAIRLVEGLRVDGRLDEQIYHSVPPIGGFEQIEPKAGEPSTEKTDVWISFNGEFVFVSVRCWDSAREEQWVVNGIVRDSSSIPRSENIAFTRTRLAPTFGSAGNTSPAASCSRCTPTSATHASAVIRTSKTAPSWSRSIGCSGSDSAAFEECSDENSFAGRSRARP